MPARVAPLVEVMRTILIDNYDSFTYNLFHLIAEALGPAPDVFYNDEITWQELQAGGYEAVIISPGPGHPKRPGDFGICERIVKEFDGPILGVCLGYQGIAHHAGATVDLAPVPMHGRVSTVRHDGTGLFKNIPQDFEVVRYHSLLVTDTGPNIEITATTPDGLAMALKHPTKPQWGVQFHPESICTEYGVELIRNFRELALPFVPKSAQVSEPLNTDETPLKAASLTSARVTGGGPLKLFWREIATWVEPEDCFASIFADAADAFWLDGTQTAHGMGRYSYMGDATGPYSEVIAYDVRERELRIDDGAGTHVETTSVFDHLNKRLASHGMLQPPGYQPPFVGGYVGYLGYELREDCGATKGPKSPHPDARLIFADRFIAFDNLEQRMWVACLDLPENVERAKGWLNGVMASLDQIRESDMAEPTPIDGMVFRPNQSRQDYADNIRAAKHEIRHGETYEVCLTNEFKAKGSPDPLNAYRILRRVNPAPYASYLKFDKSAVASCSPERFIKIDHQGVVESKPIKGTAKRGATKSEDERIAEELRTSEKDRSENLMIVDLLRNDLGRVCKIGSVHVPKLFAIETYKAVHQLVSTIRGTLRDDVPSIDCVRAAFPGGSMTGAPKKRTMEIIDRLEERPRGIYSGSIGFMSLTGAVDLNIVIRTAMFEEGEVSISAGGAIVDLSDVEAECDEVWLKARALLMAFNSLEASEGYWQPPIEVETPAPTEEPVEPVAPAAALETSVLEGVRQEIDAIDGELLTLLARRFGVAKRAAEFKIANDLPMMQTDRVRAVLASTADRAEREGVSGQFASDVWRLIIQEACRREIEMREGNLGTTDRATAALLQDAVVGYGQSVVELEDVDSIAEALRDCLGFELTSDERDPTRPAILATAGPVRILLVQSATNGTTAQNQSQDIVIQVRGLGLLDQDLRERGASLVGGVQRDVDCERVVAEVGNGRLRIVFQEEHSDLGQTPDHGLSGITAAAE